MRPTWIIAALCALSLSCVTAQETGTTKARIAKEVAEKQRLMREGKVVLSNVRVTVRLTNGSRIQGIVKNGRFIERHDGLAFVPSDRSAKGAGLRIWYYDQTNSYIFLPWETISEHTIGEILTDEEVARIGIELEKSATVTRGEQPAKAPTDVAKPPDPAVGEIKGAGAKPAAPGAEEPPLTPAQKELLEEFPASQGWGLERMKELEARKIRIHVYPNEQEKRFLDNFGAWNEANEIVRAWEAERAARETPAQGTTPAGASPATGTPATPPGGAPGAAPKIGADPAGAQSGGSPPKRDA